MADKNLVNTLQAELATILQYNDTELVNRADWGTITFERARPDIQAALSIAKDLSGLPLEELTDGTIQQIHGSIPRVAENLKEIDEFSISSGEPPAETRDNICNQLHGGVDNLRATATPHIPYLFYRRGDIAERIAELEGTITDARAAYNEAQTWIDRKKEEIERIENAARAAAASCWRRYVHGGIRQ